MTTLANKYSLDNSTGWITAVAGAIATIIVAMLTGLWQFLSGRKRLDTEAQSSLLAGFVSLLTELKNERAQLLVRLGECEAGLHEKNRYIDRLKSLLRHHNIEIPEEEP